MSIRTVSRLSEEEKKSLKEGVIEVEGKTMGRTALGVVAAIFKLYPNITYAELKEMLPDSINPAAPKTFKHGYRPYTDLPYGVVQKKELVDKLCEENRSSGGKINQTHFTEPDELFTTSDGVTVCVARNWESKDTVTGESDLQNLIEHVVQYGIRVVSFESKNQAFKRGEYQIRVINPQLFEKLQAPEAVSQPESKPIPEQSNPPSNKRKIAIIAIAAIAILLVSSYFLIGKTNSKKDEKDNTETSNIVKKDGDESERFKKIEEQINKGENVKNTSVTFQNIFFEYDSDKIKTESASSLQEVLEFMKKYPNIKIKIVGHTSLEGSEEHNQKLSEKRASAVKDYLVKQGIEESRLIYEGMGMKKLIVQGNDEEANKQNRRTEFIIIEQ